MTGPSRRRGAATAVATQHGRGTGAVAQQGALAASAEWRQQGAPRWPLSRLVHLTPARLMLRLTGRAMTHDSRISQFRSGRWKWGYNRGRCRCSASLGLGQTRPHVLSQCTDADSAGSRSDCGRSRGCGLGVESYHGSAITQQAVPTRSSAAPYATEAAAGAANSKQVSLAALRLQPLPPLHLAAPGSTWQHLAAVPAARCHAMWRVQLRA